MSFELGIFVKSTILLTATGLIAVSMGRASASTRHALWAIGLTCLLLLPAAELLLPKIELPVWSRADEAGVASPVGQSETSVAATLSTLDRELDRAEADSGAWGAWANSWTAREWLVGVWVLGALLVWIRLFIGQWKLHQMSSGARIVDDEYWRELLSTLRTSMRVRTGARIEIRISDEAISPMTWGLVRHRILLPAGAEGWSRERHRVVLGHELAHILRRDGRTQLLLQCVTSLYWFHPLVWVAARRLRVERERACDDHVINLGINPQDYADHLLEVTRRVGSGLSLAAISMAQPSQLETRLRAILDPQVRRHAISRLTGAVFVLATGLLTLATAVGEVIAVSEPVAAAPTAVTAEMNAVTQDPAPNEVAAGIPVVIQAPAAAEGPAPARPVATSPTNSESDEPVESIDADRFVFSTQGGVAPGTSEVSVRAAQLVTGPEREARLIQPNDVIQIYVYGEPDLSAAVRVQSDGKVSSPLIQDLQAEGLTPGELRASIEQRLSQFIEFPRVTVAIESIASYTVFVMGNVQHAGAFASEAPMTVLQALARAGGVAPFGNRNEITIVRSSEGSDDVVFEFDYDLAIKGERPGQNIRLESHDVVVVP